MRTGLKFGRLVMIGVLCLGAITAEASSAHRQRKVKKPELPPLPSGPTGPIQQQIPLDSIPAVPPQVTYKEEQLTILAPNSTLGDILRAVRKQTGAEMEIPANANERVVTQLGPGPARAVVAELLNGSRFNYVLLGSPTNAGALTRVVLVAKTGGDAAGQNPPPQQQSPVQMGGVIQPPQPDIANVVPDTADAETADDTAADENADQNAAEAEQPASTPDQPGVKTPQQMLQEMQQRQLQMQQLQQQQPGAQPQQIPGYPQPPQRPQQQ